MLNLQQIEADLTTAMKAKDRLTVDTLRGLKVRIQNEQIAKIRELNEAEIVTLIRSEVKRRKEAAESFAVGGRPEMADKEAREALALEKYLPAQISETELAAIIDAVIVENNFTAADFGKAMGALKSKTGQSADGAMMAKLLKEKLK